MYNRVILMGRITHDFELKSTPTGTPVLTFQLAVERNYKAKDEERQTDFINCVAWRGTAEFIVRYFKKGSLILVEGELQTRQYLDKDNKTVKLTEVLVSQVMFTGEKQSNEHTAQIAQNDTDNTPPPAPAQPAANAQQTLNQTAVETVQAEYEDYPF